MRAVQAGSVSTTADTAAKTPGAASATNSSGLFSDARGVTPAAALDRPSTSGRTEVANTGQWLIQYVQISQKRQRQLSQTIRKLQNRISQHAKQDASTERMDEAVLANPAQALLHHKLLHSIERQKALESFDITDTAQGTAFCPAPLRCFE